VITAARECRVHGTLREIEIAYGDGTTCAAAVVTPAATRDSIIPI